MIDSIYRSDHTNNFFLKLNHHHHRARGEAVLCTRILKVALKWHHQRQSVRSVASPLSHRVQIVTLCRYVVMDRSRERERETSPGCMSMSMNMSMHMHQAGSLSSFPTPPAKLSSAQHRHQHVFSASCVLRVACCVLPCYSFSSPGAHKCFHVTSSLRTYSTDSVQHRTLHSNIRYRTEQYSTVPPTPSHFALASLERLQQIRQ